CPTEDVLRLVVERGEPAIVEVVLELARIEGVGIERATDPLATLVVLGMGRIGEGLNQPPVAPRPAPVLGPAGAPTGDARPNRPVGGGGQHLLDPDVVFPAVAEVVGVPERRALADDGVEACPPLIAWRLAPVPVWVGNAVARAPDLELVEVVVPPAEGG